MPHLKTHSKSWCEIDGSAGTWVDPGSVSGFPGDTTQFMAKQQNEDCFGNPMTPFTVGSPTWSSTNSSVASVSGGLATALSVGTTNIGANWTAFLWDMNPNNTCTKTTIHPDPTALCDVQCAVPTNFHQVGSGTDNGGVLQFNYEWDSSTGNLAHLSHCTVGEIVTYPGTSNPFVWPRPPFTRSNPNPSVSDMPATSGSFGDGHLGAPFAAPFTTSSFAATQFYRYKCPCSSGGNYVNLTGSISIVRSVNQNSDGTWRYTVTKSGSSATINPITP